MIWAWILKKIDMINLCSWNDAGIDDNIIFSEPIVAFGIDDFQSSIIIVGYSLGVNIFSSQMNVSMKSCGTILFFLHLKKTVD